jgi:hypothetical protein
MAKYTDSGEFYGFTTADIIKLGINRELNAKWEREKFLPKASIEPAAGPWRAGIYSEGDLIARVMMKKLTNRGLSLKVASWILNNARFIGEAFDEGELDEYNFISFPIVDKKKFNRKADPGAQPFNTWAELDGRYQKNEHDEFVVLDIGKIRSEVKALQ